MSAATAPVATSWRDLLGRPPVLIAVGLSAYAVALVATLPAQAVAGRGAAGTIWHGTAPLHGGVVAAWDWLPVDSLAHGSLSARWTANGAGTQLTGIVRRGAFGPELVQVTGRSSWTVLAASVPGLSGGCAIPLDVALDRAAADSVTGTVHTGVGTCPAGAGAVRAIPRLIAIFSGARGVITPWSDRSRTLATIAITRHAVRLHTTPAGAAILPGPGSTADIEIAL